MDEWEMFKSMFDFSPQRGEDVGRSGEGKRRGYCGECFGTDIAGWMLEKIRVFR